MNTNHQALNAFLIADYVNQRIRQNHQLFDSVIVKNENGIAQNLWQMLYGVIYRAYLNGDTLFWLDETMMEYEIMVNGDLQRIVLPHWQWAIITGLYAPINQIIENHYQHTGDWLLKEWQVCWHIQDKTAFMTKIQEIQKTAKTTLDSMGNNALLNNECYQAIVLWFRFLYLIKFWCGSLQGFYAFLMAQSFCQIAPLDGQMSATYDRPLIVSAFDERQQGFGIWLNRAFVAEVSLARSLGELLSQSPKREKALTVSLNHQLSNEQKNAILFALSHNFSIITGGPGTGKTFVVAQLVILLHQMSQPDLPILALTAPTGKAAQRMQESLQNSLTKAGVQIPLPTATTIHRLIGVGRAGIPRHNAKNPILADVVVVDEASMLDASLAADLFLAIGKHTKLILLGDVNQLAAVGAGKVLADLCQLPALHPYHQTLTISQRFSSESGVGRLASFINHRTDGGVEQTHFADFLAIVNQESALSFYPIGQLMAMDYQQKLAMLSTIYDHLAQGFDEFWQACLAMYGQVDDDGVRQLFDKLLNYRILTATHTGAFGDNRINNEIANRHLAYYRQRTRHTKRYEQHGSDWYHGRMVMVVKNHYELGLFNGDVGICLYRQTPDGGSFVVCFENKSPIPVALLSQSGLIVTAYAMTIHKSQGSEFEKVAICLMGGDNNALLGRELFYTAVTRAKGQIDIISDSATITKALTTKVQRQTGLGMLFHHFI